MYFWLKSLVSLVPSKAFPLVIWKYGPLAKTAHQTVCKTVYNLLLLFVHEFQQFYNNGNLLLYFVQHRPIPTPHLGR